MRRACRLRHLPGCEDRTRVLLGTPCSLDSPDFDLYPLPVQQILLQARRERNASPQESPQVAAQRTAQEAAHCALRTQTLLEPIRAALASPQVLPSPLVLPSGRWLTQPRDWLQERLDECDHLRDRHGTEMWYTPAGRDLAKSLEDFALWRTRARNPYLHHQALIEKRAGHWEPIHARRRPRVPRRRRYGR